MPSEPDPAPLVTVRYWAGAKAAAGVASDELSGDTVGAVAEAAGALRPALRPVLAVSTFLVDGVASRPDELVPAGATIEVLPPFAGG